MLCISQATHAWVAGQLARAWGRAPVSPFQPFEEVSLGTEQHDLGWIPWDTAPRLNPATGFPYNFTEMPLLDHLTIWSRGAEWMPQVSRYAGLLVSMHNRALCERFSHPKNDEEVQAVNSFLSRQASLEEKLLSSLQADPQYADWSHGDVAHHNSRLVWIWDTISLHLCMGLSDEMAIEGVPGKEGATRLTLSPSAPDEVTVSPWPFHVESLTVPCDGRVLSGRFTDDTTLQEAFQEAPTVTLRLRLQPP